MSEGCRLWQVACQRDADYGCRLWMQTMAAERMSEGCRQWMQTMAEGCRLLYEELTRLAETRLAQHTLSYLNIAWLILNYLNYLERQLNLHWCIAYTTLHYLFKVFWASLVSASLVNSSYGVCVYIYICTHTCIYIYIYMCVYIYIYIYVHTYLYTYISLSVSLSLYIYI